MTLPEAFQTRMKAWLTTEWPEFRDAILDAPSVRGVRFHRISLAAANEKPSTSLDVDYALQAHPLTTPERVLSALSQTVPWSSDSYYIPRDSWLGKSVYHETGAFYLQEPSAMAVVAALNPQPGERVLDLCAAPGGKTTAIGKHMKASGVLVANEIHPTRVLTLAQNVERLGVVAAITNETPQRLAQVFPSCFDAVLVDAPCSGEGMFRKDPSARSEWSIDTPETCAARQKEIFAEAIRMTRPGGRIVYSTCTFNPVENEQVIQWALDTFPLTVLPLPDWPGWESGRPDWADGRIELLHTRRLWPHKGQGEGHFVASLQVTEGETSTTQTDKFNTQAAIHSSAWSDWAPLIAKPPLSTNWESPLVQGDLWFARSAFKAPSVKLRLLRPGLCLAQQHKGRFEPHHSLAMAIAPDKVQSPVNLSYDDAARYLSGQTVDPVDEAGYVWLHIDGLPLGWGKSVPGRINNLFPKGLRKHDLV